MLSIRKIGVIGRTYRHLNRYRQILTILFKYGFGDLLDLLRIDQYIELGLQLISKKKRGPIEKLSGAKKLRMACEELGPTYIKLGQLLSTRPDLIPVDVADELSKLQDDIPPAPFDDVRRIIESDLNAPLEDAFVFFNQTALASASIGQVYQARLTDGEDVAVKVQRPDIKKKIEVDLEIMLHLATLMERHIEEIAIYRPVKIVEEFTAVLEKELDYTLEATNVERIARQTLNNPYVYVPKVHQNLTTDRVLTMEYIKGIKISETDRLDREGLDRKIIVSRGADLVLKQIFNHGFFHADPHPGNIFILPDNVICLLDFGMCGSLHKQIKEQFVDLIDCIILKSEGKAAKLLCRLADWDDEPDMRLLEKDISDFMEMHLYKPIKDIKFGKLSAHLLDIISRHRLRLLPDVFLMMKVIVTLEGIVLKIDPDFNMINHAAPFIEKIKLSRFNPKRITYSVLDHLNDIVQFINLFPKDVLEISKMVKQQKLTVNFEHKGLDTMLATHDQISNRMSFSIIIAALIIGSALIVISEMPPLIYGISLIGLIGFLAAAVMGIWLLIAILRKGRL